MKKCLYVTALCGVFCLPSFAAEISVSKFGISFSIPDNWKYEVHEQPGGAFVFIKPTRDESPNIANRCRIDAHELPARFRSYTQEQLNNAYASKPLTSESFAGQLSQATGQHVVVSQIGQSMLGKNLAFWAIATSSESVGPTTAYFAAKHYLTQSPKYSWNIQCGSGSTTTAVAASTAFNNKAPVFEVFFASLQLSK
jgi:hypothetical protein